MGIFSDYDIDIDSVKENSFDIADGTYRFTVAEAEQLDGTANKPDTTFFVIDYQLEDEDGDTAGSKREWFTLAEEGQQTKRSTQSLSFLKGRLISLGLKGAQLQDFDGSEIIGKTGVLTLKTKPGKNGQGSFQNIGTFKVDEGQEEEKPARKAPAKTTAKPAAKKPVAKPAPAEEPDEDDDADDDNPFG